MWTGSLDERSDDREGEDTFEEFLWEREYCGVGHEGGREKGEELAALINGLRI